MKRAIALILSCCLLLSACSPAVDAEGSSKSGAASFSSNPTASQENVPGIEKPDFPEDTSAAPVEFQIIIPEYNSLNDPALLTYIEDSVYAELVNNLDSNYFVQNISAVYVSKEYLAEVSYNSKSNIFFGYTLAELDDQFQGTRYVFTLSDEGETTVEPFEEYDDTYEQVLKNVAIGSGVILICVTVSVISGGTAPAISMIFAASAKTGTIMALSSGGMGGLAAGIVTGVQTKDFDEAIKAAALAGSEGFKWGAISGAISGGASEAVALKGVTLNGLTMNEAAAIQRESKYPLDVIKQFKSMKEYQIYKDAGLKAKIINGKISLVRDIDLNYESNLAGKTVTNLERMQQGYAPINPATGEYYQLHHINQNADGTLAILTELEHQGNSSILNKPGVAKEISEAAWTKQRKDYWKAFAAAVGG